MSTSHSLSSAHEGRLRFVMYHYVREFNDELPYFKFLDFYDFKRQLDDFEKHYFFPTREQLVAFVEGDRNVLPQDRQSVVLTFDDGLIDHYNYVLPELRRRGFWGIFYISSGPLVHKPLLLDVHKVHALLGRFSSKLVLEQTENIMKSASEFVCTELVGEFRSSTYTAEMQTNDEATSAFKRLINYFLKPELKNKVLNSLMDCFFPNCSDKLAQAWYMNAEQLEIMSSCGMVLGAHSVSHPVLSTLTHDEQLFEIRESLKRVSEITDNNPPPGGSPSFRSFCFPYGGRHTYDDHCLEVLSEEGCLFSLDVDPKDCDDQMLKTHRQNLPRWDCNKFSFGQCFHGVPPSRVQNSPGDPTGALLASLLQRPKIRYKSITLFTGQQPRHVSLIRRISALTDVLYVVQEVAGSLTPGKQASSAFAEYFSKVKASEQKYFGDVQFSPNNTRTLSILSGDASKLELRSYGDALNSEIFVVFGASFLKGELGNFLESRRAINCHIGLSPYYRGSATTFWALRDGNYRHNGATIHHLTSTLDGGDIICHALPTLGDDVKDAFDFTMKTVKVAHDALLKMLESGFLWRCVWTKQMSSLLLRSCKKSDFTESVASNWFECCPSRKELETGLSRSANVSGLVRPFFG